MSKKAQVGNEHSVPCKSYFNAGQYQLDDPNRSGASRFQMANWLRDNDHKVPHSKDGMCRSMKQNGEPVPQPNYELEEFACGNRRDDALHNKSFEEIRAMAINYNNNNMFATKEIMRQSLRKKSNSRYYKKCLSTIPVVNSHNEFDPLVQLSL